MHVEGPIRGAGAGAQTALFVQADGAKLEQALGNLVDNAIKYSPAGGSVRIASAVDGDRVHVSVTDEGLGITLADRSRLFQRFSRIDHPATRGVRSTGLGLYLVREQIQRMGGEVTVESEPGRGSTFTISIPLAADADADAEETAA